MDPHALVVDDDISLDAKEGMPHVHHAMALLTDQIYALEPFSLHVSLQVALRNFFAKSEAFLENSI
jgi:hypothetical protein